MSLRTKILSGIILTLAILVALFQFIATGILTESFQKIETEQVQRNLDRAQDALSEVINNLNIKSSDWASWDDTYKFVQDQYTEYIKSNLLPDSLVNLEINIMLFYNSQNTLVASLAVDPQTGGAIPVSPSLLSYISRTPQLLAHSVDSLQSGLISLPEGSLIFSSRPVLTSVGLGPVQGTLIFARSLDAKLQSRLADLTHLQLTFLPTTSAVSTQSLVVNAIDSKTVVGLAQINDHLNRPALILQVTSSRDTYNQGQSAIRYFSLAAITIGIVLAVVIALTLDFTVLRRIFRLAAAVRQIGNLQSSSVSIPTSGNDELARLGQDIKVMYGQIDHSRHELSSILSAMGEGLFVVNRDYQIVHFNPVAQKVLGLGKEHLGHKLSELSAVYKNDQLINPDQRPVAVTLKTGQTTSGQLQDNYPLEATLPGQKFPISFISTPLKDESDQTIGAVVTFRDITPELRLETQLKQERDRAKAIISSMGDGLLVIDPNYKIAAMNPTAEKLLGLPASEAVGKPWSDVVTTFIGDAEIPYAERTAIKSLKTGKPIITTLDDDHYYQTQTGRRFPVTSTTTPIPKESGGGVVKVFSDATHDKTEKIFIETQVKARTRELMQKNLALQSAKTKISEAWVQVQNEKARLSASIDSLSLGFLLVDTADQIIITNPAAAKILKFDRNLTSLKDVESLLKDQCDLHQLHQQAQKTKQSVNLPEIHYGGMYLRLFLNPITTLGDHPEYIGTAIVLEDITEAKIIDRSKDEFFSIASHELRTPLTAIRGNTSMMLEYFADKFADQDLKEMVQDTHESSVRLIGIVNDFLNLSRLEQGKIEFKKSQFDLTQLIKNVISELLSQAAQKGLGLILDPSTPPSVSVNSDPDKVKEVLINLIGNSINYTDSGSITISATTTDHQIKVSVTDTGRGINPDNQNLLFRKFQQAGASLYTRDTTKGTGLGLYISKLIIESLGGKIGLEWSKPGQGSSFFFMLPA